LPDQAVWFGEVSLAGEIRPVAHSGIRLREAGKLGFDRACGPADAGPKVPGVRFDALTLLPNLVDRIMANP
jgi:DNA repair protein RadA/Sms